MPESETSALQVEIEEDPPRGRFKLVDDAGQMLAWARETGTSIMSTCPFANAMFERNPDTHDVLA